MDLYVAAHPSELLGIRLSANFGSVEGDDNFIINKGGEEVARLNRNLNFKSSITEANLMFELYPTVLFEDQPTDQPGKVETLWCYLVSVFFILIRWVNMLIRILRRQPGFICNLYIQKVKDLLPTDQIIRLHRLNIPMGVGVKYYVNETINLSLELLYRKTFTDYIDDVSTTFVDPAVLAANLPSGTSTIAIAMSNKSPLQGIPGSGL